MDKPNVNQALRISYQLEAIGKSISAWAGDGDYEEPPGQCTLAMRPGDIITLSGMLVELALKQQRLLDPPGETT
jgi:hypothetical protein